MGADALGRRIGERRYRENRADHLAAQAAEERPALVPELVEHEYAALVEQWFVQNLMLIKRNRVQRYDVLERNYQKLSGN